MYDTNGARGSPFICTVKLFRACSCLLLRTFYGKFPGKIGACACNRYQAFPLLLSEGLGTRLHEMWCLLGFWQHFLAMWLVDFSKKASVKRSTIEISQAAVCWSAILILQAPTWPHPPRAQTGYQLRMRMLNIAMCTWLYICVVRE